MKKASISELKNQLSAYLQRVRAGQTVIVYDRNRPIARIEDEIAVVQAELRQLNATLGLQIEPDGEIIEVLVTLKPATGGAA